MKWRTFALAGACLAMPGIAQAQGRVEALSKVELLALQQEMRDRGCGNRHAPGVITAETRRAVRNCMRQHNVSTAHDLLVAFNIGFGPGEPGGLGIGIQGATTPFGAAAPDEPRPPMIMDTDPNRPGVQQDTTPGMRRGVEGTQPGQTRTRARGTRRPAGAAKPKPATPAKPRYP